MPEFEATWGQRGVLDARTTIQPPSRLKKALDDAGWAWKIQDVLTDCQRPLTLNASNFGHVQVFSSLFGASAKVAGMSGENHSERPTL